MKKTVLALALILSINLYGEWKDNWALAVGMCEEGKYQEAEKKFTECIDEIELINDQKGLHVYIDRARLYLLQKKYSQALKDLDKAIDNPNLNKKEQTRALVSRICAKSNLGISEGVVSDLTAFGESLPYSPTIEFTEKYIIIRNAPESECFKNIVCKFLLSNGYCKNIKDIKY